LHDKNKKGILQPSENKRVKCFGLTRKHIIQFCCKFWHFKMIKLIWLSMQIKMTAYYDDYCKFVFALEGDKLGAVHKWRHCPRGKGVKDIVIWQYRGILLKSATMGGGVSKLLKNCVTSFMDDPLITLN